MLGSKFVRIFSLSSRNFAAKAGTDHAGHAETQKLWKNLTYFVAFPAITICMINAGLAEKEHLAHFHRPEFIPYEHMRIRTRPFPWGDGNHSLFHNKKVNALPDGYEE